MTQSVTVRILHAFAHQGEGGNPAGVGLVIEQGAFMAPPSRSRLVVRLEFERRTIARLFVGGVARYGERREVRL